MRVSVLRNSGGSIGSVGETVKGANFAGIEGSTHPFVEGMIVSGRVPFVGICKVAVSLRGKVGDRIDERVGRYVGIVDV